MINITNTINNKIHMMAEKNLQKLFFEVSLDLNIESYSKFNRLVQLESKIIKCNLKKKGADILIIFILSLMLVSIV